jgi:hypothetical protein
MRTLIRDLKTQTYYAAEGQWTVEREAARDFGSTSQAMSFAGQQQLHGVQVVLAFDNPEYDAVINFQREQRPPETYQEGTGR